LKVRDISTGRILEVNGCYGMRLIEQGMAVMVRDGSDHSGASGGKRHTETGVIPSVSLCEPAPLMKGSQETARRRKGKGELDGAGG